MFIVVLALFCKKHYLCKMKIYFVKDIEAFSDDFIESCVSFFPQWRKLQMLSYKHHKGKIRNALAYLLLIKALREEGIFKELPEFYYNKNKKPFLKNYQGWHFNISHCKTAVCCVLSRYEVGIDIEEVKEYKESLATYICNEEELHTIHHSDNQANDFYKLWTRKEAVFKLIGTGITKDIKNIMHTDNVHVISGKIEGLWMSVATFKQS